MKHLTLKLAALVLTASTASLAHATPINLVSNPGFEDYNPALKGWGGTSNGVTRNTGVPAERDANPGSIAAAKFGVKRTGYQTIEQSIATTSGKTYVLNFWLKLVDSGVDDEFKFDFGSFTGQGQRLNISAFDWTEVTQEFTANSSSMLLKFYGRVASGSSNAYYLDDVSVTEESVPVPASLPLLGLGLIGVFLGSRARRAA
jgi:hypothetical protein